MALTFGRTLCDPVSTWLILWFKFESECIYPPKMPWSFDARDNLLLLSMSKVWSRLSFLFGCYLVSFTPVLEPVASCLVLLATLKLNKNYGYPDDTPFGVFAGFLHKSSHTLAICYISSFGSSSFKWFNFLMFRLFLIVEAYDVLEKLTIWLPPVHDWTMVSAAAPVPWAVSWSWSLWNLLKNCVSFCVLEFISVMPCFGVGTAFLILIAVACWVGCVGWLARKLW